MQELSKELGGYKAGFGIKIDPDSTDTKKNTISLNRNLGRDMDSTDKATLEADANKNALVLGGRVNSGSTSGGQTPEKDYGALGQDSVTVGGADNTVTANGDAAVVVGGLSNKADAQYSTVVGGSANDAAGNESSVFGGFDNDAYGTYATLSGGSMNKAYGDASSVFGGYMNNATGASSVAIGGSNSFVTGLASVGIAGGSTTADNAFAAGNGANVTVNNGTAIGYQATANKEGTVAFGHDAGDANYSASTTWKQKATKEGEKYYDDHHNEITEAQYEALRNADNTFNDYSQPPTYSQSYYNRLVKVADGVDPHDVVVMEQLSKAQNDLKVNAGWGINIEDVTTKDENGKEMTKKNVISLKRNLGKNYGSRYGTGKVNFEADGENSLILGGGALNDSWEDRDKEVTYGAHGKDSILVGGLNNDIAKDSEKVATSIGTKASIGTRAVIIGGTSNTVSYDPVTEKDPDTGKEKVKVDSNGNVIVQTQKTGTDAIIVGGLQNTAKGDGSVLIGGESNEATGFYSTVIGGTSNKTDGWLSSIFGGTKNTITGAPTAAGIFGGTGNTINSNGIAANVFGGENNTADNTLAVVVGGETNTSSGPASIILGGNHNTANQLLATVVGGQLNTATGETSMISGGIGNVTSGAYSYDAGGLYNRVTGMAASSLGGLNSSVNGMFSTGVAGGSTGENTILSLAAGYQSVVTDSGVEKTYVTGDDAEKVLEDQYSGKELPGYYTRDQSVDYGPGEPGRLIHYDKFSTALGYQATADEPGTIAFGHDAGDESGYTYEWETLTDENGNPKQNEIDGTTNDYTKAPKSVKKKAPYTSSYYNRLVKVADGIDDHDVVVMEQLKQYAEKDASNIGNNIKVYKTDANGNVQLDKDKKPIEETDATTTAQNGSKDAWGKALGAGTFTTGTDTTPTNASISDQLVTGKTLYDYDKPTGSTNYVKVNNTTGQNLSALDAQVKANADALDKPNHNIKYYSVKTAPLTVDGYTNEKNDGAQGKGSIAAGFVTHADGIASTVTGSYSGVINSGTAQGLDLRGAAALSYGTVNVNQNTDSTKAYSGVANSIVGQANMTTNSNAAIIYGAGNTVTDSYRPIDKEKAKAILDSTSDPKALSKAMQDAVKDSGGQVMVMGGGNVVDNAYMSQVTGVGNTVKGNQVYAKNAKTGKLEWTTDTNKDTAIKDYDPEKSSQYNYVDGFSNEVINGKHDYVIGANNKLSGDSYDDDAKPIKRSNRSNIVIGDNHTLTREQNTVIIGSSDTENTQTKARDAVIIGHNANATNDTGADNAVAIGRSANATGGNAVTIGVNTSAGENSITIGSESSAISGSNIAIGRSVQVYGYKVTNAVALGENTKALVSDGVAIGSESQATVKGNSAEGYDPVTGKDSTDETATWKATKAAVSIGKADGTVTRQINGLAAGTNDTDAVNVAQLKKLEGMKANVDATNIGKNLKGTDGKTVSDEDITANEKAWGAALGTGDIATPKDMLVTDKAIHDELRPTTDGTYVKGSQTTAENLSKLDAQVKTNADGISTNTTNITKNAGDITKLKNLSNITNEGRTVIKNLSKDAVKVAAGDRISVAENVDSATGNKTYTVSAKNDGKVVAGNQNLVSGDTVNTAINNAITNAGTATDTKLAGKANVDASNIGANLDGTDQEKTANKNAWGTAIGTGAVTKDNGQLVTGKTVYNALHGGLDDITIGHDGKDGQPGKDGSIGLVGQTGAKGKDGKNAYATTIIKTEKGAAGVNGKDGEDGITRIVYNDTNDPSKQQTVATLDDGMKFKGDGGTVIAKKLNSTLDIIGGATGTLSDGNIGVNSTADGKLKIQLAKDLTGMNSTAYTKKDGAGDSATTSTTVVDGNGLTIKSTVTKDGKTETVNGPSVTKDGIDAGNKQITNISNGIEKDSNGKYTITDQNKGNAANVSDVQNIVNDAKKDLTNGANGLNSKANVDASNIGENMKDAKGNKASAAEITKNKEAWASAISTDTVAKGNKQLVTSDAVATALDSKADKTYVDKQLDTKANKSDVYTKDQTYSKSEVDSKVSNITTGLDGKAGKDLDNISDKGQQVIHNIAKDAVEVVDGTNTTVTKTEGTNTTPTKYAVNVEGKGKVASGDTGLISGDTLYKEVHVDTDGSYIKGSQSVGQNLSNLDTGLKTTSDLIHTNEKGDTIQIGGNSTATKIDISGKDKDGKSTGRVITGVVSDANDPNSAANVGYVNGITSASNEQIYHDMNMQYNHVENDISRAAAGSNALAALHPMQEFDPDDKAQFALGYGHYRNSNAGAVGAFYQPDENSMVNFGVSFGNGDAGINAGVTFKFGPGGSGHHALTKTQMAKVIDAQSKEIDELKKDNADKDKRIDALEQKMTEILAKLDKSKD